MAGLWSPVWSMLGSKSHETPRAGAGLGVRAMQVYLKPQHGGDHPGGVAGGQDGLLSGGLSSPAFTGGGTWLCRGANRGCTGAGGGPGRAGIPFQFGFNIEGHLPCDPDIPLLGIDSKELKPERPTGTCQ